MEEINYEADLGAEKLIAASKENRKIVVEVKSFLKQSKTYEMHGALGQFNTYTLALKEQEPNRKLYLAVTEGTYETFFRKRFIQKIINHFNVSILVFDAKQKKVIKWIE